MLICAGAPVTPGPLCGPEGILWAADLTAGHVEIVANGASDANAPLQVRCCSCGCARMYLLCVLLWCTGAFGWVKAKAACVCAQGLDGVLGLPFCFAVCVSPPLGTSGPATPGRDAAAAPQTAEEKARALASQAAARGYVSGARGGWVTRMCTCMPRQLNRLYVWVSQCV